jgi:hypothetical protein
MHVRLGGLDVLLELANDQPMPQQGWDRRSDLVRALVARNNGDASRIRTLVVTDGGAPNARQRNEMDAAVRKQPSKTAVVTNALGNPLVRGIATAVRWVNPAFKAVGPESWEQALEHVDLIEHGPILLVHLTELQTRLPPIKTLATISAEIRLANPARNPRA